MIGIVLEGTRCCTLMNLCTRGEKIILPLKKKFSVISTCGSKVEFKRRFLKVCFGERKKNPSKNPSKLTVTVTFI